MERNQLLVVWVTIFLLVICCAIPPWSETYQRPGISRVYRPIGYYPLFAPPKKVGGSIYDGVTVDFDRLIIQCVVVIVLGTGALITLGRKR